MKECLKCQLNNCPVFNIHASTSSDTSYCLSCHQCSVVYSSYVDWESSYLAAIAQRHTLLRDRDHLALLHKLVCIYGKVNQYCESLERTTTGITVLVWAQTQLIVTPNYKFQCNSVTLIKVQHLIHVLFLELLVIENTWGKSVMDCGGVGRGGGVWGKTKVRG